MSERWTREELAAKVDWEGGISETITGYGIPPDRLPHDVPQEVADAWWRVYSTREDLDIIDRWLSD